MKRTLKKALSLFVVFAMMMSAFCAYSSALFEKYEYVCLGDSVSNGYGLDGYLKEDGTNVRGYKQIVKSAYHYIVAQEFDFELEQMGFSGFRAEDMLYMLDPSYPSDSYTQGYFIDTDRFGNCGGLEKMREEYEEAVKNADYISINLGSNNFGTYFGEQLDKLEAGEAPYPYDRPGYSKNSKLLKSAEYKEIEATLKTYLNKIGATANMAKVLLESVAYTYTGFMECYDACIERIFELNPDVTIIALGMYNPVEDVKLVNGMINIGDVAGMFVEHINKHIREKAPYSDTEQYIYVNIRGCHIPGVDGDMLDSDFFTKMYENSSMAVHPDEQGHADIAERIIERLKAPYYDVNKEDAYYDAVAYVYENGLMDGKEVHEFAPNSIATRGMIATALYKNAGEVSVDSDIKFTDVSDGKYYTEAVKWAVENDIISPMTKKIFVPFGGMTRQKLMTVLWKLAGEQESDYSLNGFTDSFLISKSAKTAMAWAVENGLIDTAYGKFLAPTKMATRADLAQALMVFCEM